MIMTESIVPLVSRMYDEFWIFIILWQYKQMIMRLRLLGLETEGLVLHSTQYWNSWWGPVLAHSNQQQQQGPDSNTNYGCCGWITQSGGKVQAAGTGSLLVQTTQQYSGVQILDLRS